MATKKKRKKKWNEMTKGERARTGRRTVALAAIFATGSGAHSRKDARKLRHAPSREEW